MEGGITIVGIIGGGPLKKLVTGGLIFTDVTFS